MNILQMGLVLLTMVTTNPDIKECKHCHKPTITKNSQLTKVQVKEYARQVSKDFSFNLPETEIEALSKLCFKESSYNYKAGTKLSSATGLYGLLKDKYPRRIPIFCPYCQTRYALVYIKRRYTGLPSRAWTHHRQQARVRGKRGGWY